MILVNASPMATGTYRLEVLIPSPGFAFGQAFDVFHKANPSLYWTSLALVHGIAWFCLIAACVIAPRSWQDRPAGATRVRWRERWRLWGLGNSAERVAYRRRLLDQNAIYWLDARARLKPLAVWAVLGVLACVWVWGALTYPRDWLDPNTYILTGIALNCLLKLWVAMDNSRQLAEDHKSGALELLLSTPLTVGEILHGQLLGLVRQFFGPLLVVLLAGIALVAAGCASPDMRGEFPGGWIAAWVLAIFLLPADLLALHWLGMWTALTAKSPMQAGINTGVRILVLPWALLGITTVVLGLVNFYIPLNLGDMFGCELGFGLGMATDIIFIVWARHQLLTRFRAVAVQRYTPRKSLWRRWFG